MKKFTRYVDQIANRIISNGPAQTRTRHQDDDQVTLPFPNTSTSPPTHRGSSTPIDSRPKGSLMSRVRRRIGKKSTNECRCLIDILDDDALLAIFDYYVSQNDYFDGETEEWQTLVHVCHRWRIIVFESPRRLKLRLVCTNTTPARDRLDIWPPLPLCILCRYTLEETPENVVAVLERSNRVYQIALSEFSSFDFEKISAAMEVPFPELTFLLLSSGEKTERILPDSFLGGSAPRLRILSFFGIPFPGLPNLLLSATHLILIRLEDIPHSGYFSPEAIVAALSNLNSLGQLWLQFLSPLSRPDRRPPPPTRFALPALTEFQLRGASEYLEDLVARIDAPRLGKLEITVFNQIIFDMPQFIQFIGRTTLKAPKEARIIFEDGASRVNFSSQTSEYEHFQVKIPCNELDWQISSMEQVFTSCLPHLSTLEGLSIDAPGGWLPDWQDNVENTLWLELLLPFTTVKKLYLSVEFAPRIVPALQELGEDRRTDVLPALENIFLEGLAASGPVEIREGHWTVRCHAPGHRSPYSSYTLGQRLSLGCGLSLVQRKGRFLEVQFPPSASLQ